MYKNFNQIPLETIWGCHKGKGFVNNAMIFNDRDFASGLSFINYTVIPPGSTIGNHQHTDNEEVYIILEGSGKMHIDEQTIAVTAGHILVNKPFGTHGLENDSVSDLRILVFEVNR